jgi:ribose/xylose/arabinose/galactoside ABC-type transport system permease subunit
LRQTHPAPDGTRFISKVDMVFVMLLAAAVAAASLVLAARELISLMSAPVTLELPLENVRPGTIEPTPEAVVEARYTAVDVTLAGIPPYEFKLLAWSVLLVAACIVAVCGLVFGVALQLFRGRPFATALTWGIAVTGIFVAAAGMAAQVLDAAARNRLVASLSLFPHAGGNYYIMEFNPAPLAVGLVMALIAGIFQRGQRLQRDSEGLV